MLLTFVHVAAISTSISPTHSSRSFPLFLNILRYRGIRALYSGLTPCLLRAFPMHAVILAVFEGLNRWMLGKDE